MPSTKKPRLYVKVVTPTSRLDEDIFCLPQEISSRICASHTSCKVKQQQVRPMYAPYKGVSITPLLMHWDQPQPP